MKKNDFEVAINILRQHQLHAEAIMLISDNSDAMDTYNGLKEAIDILKNSSKKDVRDLNEVGHEAAKEATEDYGYEEREITWNGKDFEGDTI